MYYFALDPLFPLLTIDAAAAVIIHRSLHLSKQYFGAEQSRAGKLDAFLLLPLVPSTSVMCVCVVLLVCSLPPHFVSLEMFEAKSSSNWHKFFPISRIPIPLE